ncbi:MAG: molybdopterin-dependent oxidoreductase family protein [Planctomycetota bacterium]
MDHGPHTTDHPDAPRPDGTGTDVDRRDFLITAGFAVSAAALAGCSRAPVQHALPFVNQPEGQRAGQSQWFATTCHGCEAACGMLAKVRDGRPVKLEGNPLHPVGGGGLCAVGQAALLESYDDHRFNAPQEGLNRSTWEAVDQAVIAKLDALRAKGAVRVLTAGHLGPTTRAALDAFCGRFADGRHIAFDGLSTSAIRAAYARTHGVAVLPHYRFDRADVIVSFDADFLGTWISPVEFASAYQAGRVPMGTPPRMSHHVQIESRLSLTGGSADVRHCVAPGELGAVLSRLAAHVAKHAGVAFDAPATAAVPDAALATLADRLWAARGKALICSGSQDVAVQELAAHCNAWLQADGATVDVAHPSLQQSGDDAAVAELVAEINAGRVAALIVAGANPVYALPGGEALAAAAAKLPLIIACAERPDETTALAHYTAPTPHFLERWDDAEPVSGVAAVTQPTRPPRAGTRPLLETLAAWSGSPSPAYDQIRAHWRRVLHVRQTERTGFDAFWDRTVHDGVTTLRRPRSGAGHGAAKPTAVAAAAAAKDFTLVAYPKVGLRDGRPAHNPWLQELPDPISKVTWDNYACLSTAAAKLLKVERGDVSRWWCSPASTIPWWRWRWATAGPGPNGSRRSARNGSRATPPSARTAAWGSTSRRPCRGAAGGSTPAPACGSPPPACGSPPPASTASSRPPRSTTRSTCRRTWRRPAMNRGRSRRPPRWPPSPRIPSTPVPPPRTTPRRVSCGRTITPTPAATGG